MSACLTVVIDSHFFIDEVWTVIVDYALHLHKRTVRADECRRGSVGSAIAAYWLDLEGNVEGVGSVLRIIRCSGQQAKRWALGNSDCHVFGYGGTFGDVPHNPNLVDAGLCETSARLERITVAYFG